MVHKVLDPKLAKLVKQNGEVEAQWLEHLATLAGSGLADTRWALIARTHFEQGFMALNRAIAEKQS